MTQHSFHSARDFGPRSIARASGCAALLLASAACGDEPHSSDDTSSLALPAQDILDAHQAAQEFPAAVMALHDPVRGGALVTSGTTRPGAQGSAVDPDVPWVIGSATKLFVAVTALQLAEEGRLDLDASLELYFPELPRATEIRARDLLQHTSGMNEYLSSPAVLSDLGRFWSPAELVDAAVALGPVAEPGTDHHYANTNYILLGELIEQVTGHAWYDEVEARILVPLGMQHTHYAGDASAPPMGPGYSLEAGQFVETTTLADASVGGAAGALQSTAADLLRFARALSEGSLLDPQRQAAMRAFVPGEPRGYLGHEYGLGFEKYVVRDVTVYGHAGSAPAHGSFIGFDPDSGLAVSVVINSSEPAPAPMMALEVVAAVTGRDVSPPADAAAPPAAAQ